MSPRSHRAGGFTLVEMVIALAISAVIIVGALGLLMAQQHAFQAGSFDRAQQETARIALDAISSNLRMAGYGVDPAFAFDFGPQATVTMARAPTGAAVSAGSLGCTSAVSCRDKTDQPDELVFRSRDPAFGYPLATAYGGGTTLNITGPLRSPLTKGQILQVMCFTGNMLWAYVTVASNVAAAPAAAQVSIPITSSSTYAFPAQNPILADGCFANAAPQGSSAAVVNNAAKVFKIDTYRFFVQRYDDSGATRPAGTVGARPYLMLDRGLSDTSGPISEVVAPDVEDLQLSYQFPASAPALQLIGATAATAITADNQGIDLAPTAGTPAYGDASDAPTRVTQHPGNIRTVRVSVVVRSPDFDSKLSAAADRTIPATGNRPAAQGPAGYRRQLFDTSVSIRNLEASAPSFPSYTSVANDHLNQGGG